MWMVLLLFVVMLMLVGMMTRRLMLNLALCLMPNFVTTTMMLDASGGYSVSSDPPDASRKGEWRSRDGLLEYQPENGQAWSVLGEYRLHGDRLIVIPPDNEAQVWTRQD